MADQVVRMPESRYGQNLTNSTLSTVMRKESAQTVKSTYPSNSLNLGSGKPLAANDLNYFNSRFGNDFSGVRIHDDQQADRIAQSLNARAFTYGKNIAFSKGQSDTSSREGKHLMAHELTHVLQQNDSSSSTIMRKSCGHDGKRTACGAYMGALEFTSDAWEDGPRRFAIDNIVIQSGIKIHQGGTWITQVQSPPNPVKTGKDRGYIDGLKVSSTGSLDVEVVEVKAKSSLGGGCSLATKEAKAYVTELNKIAPKVVELSAGLAADGGFRKVKGSSFKSLKAADRTKLIAAGFVESEMDWHHAWAFYNSLQNRLNVTFKTAFTSVSASLFAGGDTSNRYQAGIAWPVVCKNRKKGNTMGLKGLFYMLNGQGGVSYGCEQECPDDKEDEKRKDIGKDMPLPQFDVKGVTDSEQPSKDKQPVDQPRETPRPSISVENGDNEVDEYEDEAPQPIPEEGLPVTEIIVASGVALTTLAMLQKGLKKKKMTKAEKKVAEEAAEKVIQKLAKVDPKLAKKLDSVNIRKFGTAAYDDILKEGGEHVDDVVKRVPKKALIKKFGPKAASALMKGGARFFIVVGVVMTAADAYAMADHLSKGGEISIGLSLDETSLDGETDIEAKGEKPKSTVSGDNKLNDTKITIDTSNGVPTSGQAEIQTDKVTIEAPEGVAEGDPVTLQINMKIDNTTITIKHKGVIKGNRVLAGDIEISNSQIEIDLPPGTTIPKNPTDKPIVIKNQKIKITEVAKGGGNGNQNNQAGGKVENPVKTSGSSEEVKNPQDTSESGGEKEAESSSKGGGNAAGSEGAKTETSTITKEQKKRIESLPTHEKDLYQRIIAKSEDDKALIADASSVGKMFEITKGLTPDEAKYINDNLGDIEKGKTPQDVLDSIQKALANHRSGEILETNTAEDREKLKQKLLERIKTFKKWDSVKSNRSVILWEDNRTDFQNGEKIYARYYEKSGKLRFAADVRLEMTVTSSGEKVKKSYKVISSSIIVSSTGVVSQGDRLVGLKGEVLPLSKLFKKK